MNAAHLAAFRDRAQMEQESLFPATVRFGESATEYAACTGGFKHGDKLASGGFLDEDEIVFHVRKALLSPAPAVGSRLVWVERSRTFLILRISDGGANDPAWRFACESPNQ